MIRSDKLRIIGRVLQIIGRHDSFGQAVGNVSVAWHGGLEAWKQEYVEYVMCFYVAWQCGSWRELS